MLNWKDSPPARENRSALATPFPTTQIHVGGVRPQRPLFVGHQQAPLGTRGVAYRETLAAGTKHLPASRMGQSNGPSSIA
jgi:hypothetical protein